VGNPTRPGLARRPVGLPTVGAHFVGGGWPGAVIE